MGSKIYHKVHENPRAFFSSSSPNLLESSIQYPWGVGLHQIHLNNVCVFHSIIFLSLVLFLVCRCAILCLKTMSDTWVNMWRSELHLLQLSEEQCVFQQYLWCLLVSFLWCRYLVIMNILLFFLYSFEDLGLNKSIIYSCSILYCILFYIVFYHPKIEILVWQCIFCTIFIDICIAVNSAL